MNYRAHIGLLTLLIIAMASFYKGDGIAAKFFTGLTCVVLALAPERKENQ